MSSQRVCTGITGKKVQCKRDGERVKYTAPGGTIIERCHSHRDSIEGFIAPATRAVRARSPAPPSTPPPVGRSSLNRRLSVTSRRASMQSLPEEGVILPVFVERPQLRATPPPAAPAARPSPILEPIATEFEEDLIQLDRYASKELFGEQVVDSNLRQLKGSLQPKQSVHHLMSDAGCNETQDQKNQVSLAAIASLMERVSLLDSMVHSLASEVLRLRGEAEEEYAD